MRWTISGFLVLLGWAPCQVGTRLVKLAGLSSKSDWNLWVSWRVQSAVLASAFLYPVCSISWFGSSREECPFPIGDPDKIDLVLVFKVGDICWLKLKYVRCRILKQCAAQVFLGSHCTYTFYCIFLPYIFLLYTFYRFQLDLLEMSQFTTNFPKLCFTSVAACAPCMLQCVLLDCNGSKCTENALSIPAAVSISFLIWSFQPLI